MMVKAGRILACCALAAMLAGCAPSGDVSGWEMAPKRSGDVQPESFPDIPVVLPATPPLPATAPPAGGQGSSMRAVYSKRLDQGSLFRRGYSAPTP